MTLPEVVSPDVWRKERIALLEEEKAFTRARDVLSRKRRELPMVKVDKDYRFTAPDGTDVGLIDLFDGRHQLIVSHFMFHPDWEDGCSSCTAGAEENAPGMRAHLEVRDTRQVYVSRAPIESIERYRAKKGWTFPWYSSNGSDFNYDFHVTLDARVAPVEYNYRTPEEYEAKGEPLWLEDDDATEYPGISCFLRVDADVFHTYSLFARGVESIGGSYYLLDLTALGRQEDWELPQGRSDDLRTNQPDFAS